MAKRLRSLWSWDCNVPCQSSRCRFQDSRPCAQSWFEVIRCHWRTRSNQGEWRTQERPAIGRKEFSYCLFQDEAFGLSAVCTCLQPRLGTMDTPTLQRNVNRAHSQCNGESGSQEHPNGLTRVKILEATGEGRPRCCREALGYGVLGWFVWSAAGHHMSHVWGADTGVESTAGRVEYFIDWKHAQIERSHSVTPVS
jgi:hypothetical protein